MINPRMAGGTSRADPDGMGPDLDLTILGGQSSVKIAKDYAQLILLPFRSLEDSIHQSPRLAGRSQVTALDNGR